MLFVTDRDTGRICKSMQGNVQFILVLSQLAATLELGTACALLAVCCADEPCVVDEASAYPSDPMVEFPS